MGETHWLVWCINRSNVLLVQVLTVHLVIGSSVLFMMRMMCDHFSYLQVSDMFSLGHSGRPYFLFT